MKKNIYMLLIPLVVVGSLLLANRENKDDTFKKLNTKPLSAAERKAAKEKWEASPDGVMFIQWKASTAGKKVLAAAGKLSKLVKDSTLMEGIVTSLSLPPGSRLGFGMMVRIKEEDYILSFGPEKTNQFHQLHSLKVNDKIKIRSNGVSYAPKYAYPILAGDYVEVNSKVIYKRAPRKGGC